MTLESGIKRQFLYLQKRGATREIKIARGKGIFNSEPLYIAKEISLEVSGEAAAPVRALG